MLSWLSQESRRTKRLQSDLIIRLKIIQIQMTFSRQSEREIETFEKNYITQIYF